MNAFATGRSNQKSVVVVTRGLLEKLDPEEVKGVVAHELAHIENNDIRLMTIVVVLVGFLSILADMYWNSQLVSKASDRDSSGITQWIGLGLALFAPLTGFLMQLAVSRKREFVADARGAELANNPLGLLEALVKYS